MITFSMNLIQIFIAILIGTFGYASGKVLTGVLIKVIFSNPKVIAWGQARQNQAKKNIVKGKRQEIYEQLQHLGEFMDYLGTQLKRDTMKQMYKDFIDKDRRNYWVKTVMDMFAPESIKPKVIDATKPK
jgi:hypothetical protein